MTDKYLLLVVVLLACACSRGTTRHEVPVVEYKFPCVIKGVDVLVHANTRATDEACSVGRPKRLGDDGKPMKSNEGYGGCFSPSVKLIGEGEFEISGTLTVQLDREVLADEMEHLIYAVCRKDLSK